MAPGSGLAALASLRRWRPGLLARNSGHALLWQLVRAVCLALYLWLLARLLGPAQYGLLVAVLSLASIAGTLNGGGIGVLLLREGVRNPQAVPAIWIRSCGAVLVGFPVCFALYALAVRCLIPARVDYSIWIPLGISEIALSALSNAAASGLQSREKLGWSGALLAVPALGRLFAAVFLSAAVEIPTLSAYAALQLGCALAGTGIVLSFQQWRSAGRRFFALGEAWNWWWQGSGFSAMYLVALAAVDLDKSLVLKNSNAETAGYYALGYRVVMTFALPVTALVQALMPRLVRQISVSAGSPARTTFIAAAAVLAYSLLAALCLGEFGRNLISLFGSAYSKLDAMIPGYCLLLVIYNLRCIAGVLLYAENRPWSRAAIEGVAIGLVVVCSAVLVPRYGLSGALATAVVSETWIFLFSWVLALRLLRGKAPPGS